MQFQQEAFIDIGKAVYKKLKQILNLQLGNIDISLTTKTDLLQRLDQPQFTGMEQLIRTCINDGKCEEMETVIKSTKNMMEVSTHPPHLVDNQGRINPSAFIPFCQFNGKSFGVKLSMFSKKVCTGFKNTLFMGQKCFSLDISNFWKEDIKEGRKYGLKLLLDYNLELGIGKKYTPKETKVEKFQSEITNASFFDEPYDGTIFHSTSTYELESTKAGMLVNAIVPLHYFGGGEYVVTYLTKLDTTTAFYNLNAKVRNCQKEEANKKCINNKNTELYQKGIGICGCLPLWINFRKKISDIVVI